MPRSSVLLGQKRTGRPPKAVTLTNAERQRRYREKRVALVVGVRMTATVQELAALYEMTTSEVTAHLVRFALCNKNWKRDGFPSV